MSATTARASTRPMPLAAVAVGLTTAAAWLTTGDHAVDLTTALRQLPWVVIAVAVALPLVTIVHFLSAALALRGVSDRPLPLGQVAMVQLAAAATNRIVPNGVGGAAVNMRYMLRSGLAPGAAGSALALLAVVGGVTDALYVAGVVTIGPSIGLAGASRELARLVAAGVGAGQRSYWLLLAVVGIALVAVTVRHRGRMLAPLIRAARLAVLHLRAVVGRPRRLAVAAAASMATTAVLSAGFVLAARAWGQSSSPVSAGALVAVYWVASSAGAATPLPAFVGVSEGALVGGLVLNHYSSASALLVVLVFRAITYWLPVPVGLWAARQLKRSRLL